MCIGLNMLSHSKWTLGLMIEVCVGFETAMFRSARLRVRGTELVRPITKLVPLEMA